MTYPPQSGGWPDQSGGAWPPQDVYLDPASGQPAYLDPASGQPNYAYPGVPQYVPAYPGYPAPVPGSQRRTNGMSIASMVISIVGLLTSPCWGVGMLVGLLGAIFGHVGLRQTKQRDEDGRGLAIAGVTIGWIAVVAGIVAVSIYVWFYFWYQRELNHLNNMYPTDYPT